MTEAKTPTTIHKGQHAGLRFAADRVLEAWGEKRLPFKHAELQDELEFLKSVRDAGEHQPREVGEDV